MGGWRSNYRIAIHVALKDWWKDMIKDKAYKIAQEIMCAFRAGELESIIAVSSTHCDQLKIVPTNTPTFHVDPLNEKGAMDILQERLISGSIFNKNNVYRIGSIHQRMLQRARECYIKYILEVENPNLENMTIIINDLGDSLINQIDRDTNIQGKKCDTVTKLVLLGTPDDLLNNYKKLNKYYNSTKHASLPSNKRLLDKLNSNEGKKITMDFFETVRRVFIWYYKECAKSLPTWNELEEIDYRKYGILYKYD